jgi:hypothetical protein
MVNCALDMLRECQLFKNACLCLQNKLILKLLLIYKFDIVFAVVVGFYVTTTKFRSSSDFPALLLEENLHSVG